MPRIVLDASALLAYMHGEPGAGVVEAALERGCLVSIVNLAQVLSKLAEEGEDPAQVLLALESLGEALQVEGLDAEDAVRIARLRPPTMAAGLSLADRACLALAKRHGLPALTADAEWKRVPLGVEVTLVR